MRTDVDSKAVLTDLIVFTSCISYVKHLPVLPPPFKWNAGRRPHLRADNVYLRKANGLQERELHYILDSKDVDEAFPGETFRVLKDKEIARCGEFRTRHLVLEPWERLKAQGVLL